MVERFLVSLTHNSLSSCGVSCPGPGVGSGRTSWLPFDWLTGRIGLCRTMFTPLSSVILKIAVKPVGTTMKLIMAAVGDNRWNRRKSNEFNGVQM